MFDIYDESPDFEIPFDLLSELEQKDANNVKQTSSADVNSDAIKAAILRWRKHDHDCGSPEVQVAIANEKIKYLTKHLLNNKYDVSSRRGLAAIVNHRRKFLNYLYKIDRPKALEMVSELGIRFRPSKGSFDQESKYSSFKNTKSKWQKLRLQARQIRDSKINAKASA